ncbi:MAG TPA: hypothetical protein VFC78_02170 [Tepidisphaeraceae bacterium]|nr:hypothetical protein [Tepidisphaeraceae bacterium]
MASGLSLSAKSAPGNIGACLLDARNPYPTRAQKQVKGAGRKSEIRSTKSETNPNEESGKFEGRFGGIFFEVSSFGFWVCFGFRASDFGFSSTSCLGGENSLPRKMA